MYFIMFVRNSTRVFSKTFGKNFCTTKNENINDTLNKLIDENINLSKKNNELIKENYKYREEQKSFGGVIINTYLLGIVSAIPISWLFS